MGFCPVTEGREGFYYHYLVFLFIWKNKLFECFDFLEVNCYFYSTLKVINIRWMKGMVPSRDFNISASRQGCGSCRYMTCLTCCALRPLWVSHCKVSLQTLHCSFRKASFCGRPYTFWFILLSQLVHSSQSVHRNTSLLSCSEAGMGFLAAWWQPPGCTGQMVLYRGSSSMSTQEVSKALLRAFCSIRESFLCHQGCNQQQSLPRAIRSTGSDRH